MSDVIHNLEVVRAFAWESLRPALNHAIALAKECEFLAEHTSNLAQATVKPAYPPLVWMLAEGAPDGPVTL